MPQLTESMLEFAVFYIENGAERLGISDDEVYKRLTRGSNILDSYFIPQPIAFI